MPRETAFDKGRRMLAEARLTVTMIDGHSIAATVRGDSARVYRVGYSDGSWYCTCAAVGRCGHALALMLVVLEPGMEEVA